VPQAPLNDEFISEFSGAMKPFGGLKFQARRCTLSVRSAGRLSAYRQNLLTAKVKDQLLAAWGNFNLATAPKALAVA
jgi:hypothetical protein